MRSSSVQSGRKGLSGLWTKASLEAFSTWLHRRSRGVFVFLDARIESLIVLWIVVMSLLGAAKVATSPLPIESGVGAVTMMLPYLLIALAPIAGYRIAAGSFPRGLLSAQPSLRLCRYGSWRDVDALAARQNPSFGPTGFMASLLAGILLNVPVRSVEFILAVPAIGTDAPVWAHRLMLAMSLDVVVMNFFYMVCFVMALRSVPLFPRMLLFAWVIDVAIQISIGTYVGSAPQLPAEVGQALQNLLSGNLQKVLISATIWLPYLILSKRVNITFRQRLRA